MKVDPTTDDAQLQGKDSMFNIMFSGLFVWEVECMDLTLDI